MENKSIEQRAISVASKIIYPIIKMYWFIFRPKSFGVKCVIECDGKILGVRHTYGKHLWAFPGGGIRQGESPEEAIKREVKEEVGIEMMDLERIGEFVSTAEYKKDKVVVFGAKSRTEDFKLDKKEILEAQWFLPKNLPITAGNTALVLAVWKQRKV